MSRHHTWRCPAPLIMYKIEACRSMPKAACNEGAWSTFSSDRVIIQKLDAQEGCECMRYDRVTAVLSMHRPFVEAGNTRKSSYSTSNGEADACTAELILNGAIVEKSALSTRAGEFDWMALLQQRSTASGENVMGVASNPLGDSSICGESRSQ